jgi:xanthine dehydrogenase YagR molybdenum-binding subunit
LQDDQVRFFGQPVAVVIAETLDQAKRSGFRLAWSGADEHVTRASPTGDEAWHTTSR